MGGGGCRTPQVKAPIRSRFFYVLTIKEPISDDTGFQLSGGSITDDTAFQNTGESTSGFGGGAGGAPTPL